MTTMTVIPKEIRKEAELLIHIGYYKNEEELIIEAIRGLLEKNRKEQMALIVEMNKRKEISLGKASQLLGISYPEMVDVLGAMGVEIRTGPKSIEEAEEDLDVARELF